MLGRPAGQARADGAVAEPVDADPKQLLRGPREAGALSHLLPPAEPQAEHQAGYSSEVADITGRLLDRAPCSVQRFAVGSY